MRSVTVKYEPSYVRWGLAGPAFASPGKTQERKTISRQTLPTLQFSLRQTYLRIYEIKQLSLGGRGGDHLKTHLPPRYHSLGIISINIMTSETKNRRKKALETAVNQRKYLRESEMYGP